MTRLLIASMVLLGTVSAYADGVPRYDPPVYCEKVSEFGGGSAVIYNGCIQMEQEAYDDLKRTWSAFSARTRNYCDEVASFADRSYVILKGCIDMETDAGSRNLEFQF